MTNETKKRGIGKTLFIALFALTLISCCFLGSTFARYTTGDSGSATANIAKWGIDFTGANSGGLEITFDGLTPAMAKWSSQDAGSERKTTATVKVAEIANNGEVKADVTLTLGNLTFKNEGGSDVNNYDTTGYTLAESALEGEGASATQVSERFKVTLAYGTTDSAESATTPITSGTSFELDAEGHIYIYATITWTSADTEGELVADAIDTWIGKNVASVGVTLTYLAEQATQNPAA